MHQSTFIQTGMGGMGFEFCSNSYEKLMWLQLQETRKSDMFLEKLGHKVVSDDS